jgi:hypothetical protein
LTETKENGLWKSALPSYSVAEVQAVLRLILIFIRTEIITADKQKQFFQEESEQDLVKLVL